MKGIFPLRFGTVVVDLSLVGTALDSIGSSLSESSTELVGISCFECNVAGFADRLARDGPGNEEGAGEESTASNGSRVCFFFFEAAILRPLTGGMMLAGIGA